MIKDAYSPTSNIEIEEKKELWWCSFNNEYRCNSKGQYKLNNEEQRVEDICTSARPYI